MATAATKKNTSAGTKSQDSQARSLADKLSGLSTKAKSLGINTSQADAMVAQTKSQGSKAFKGSSYEADYKAGKYGAPTPTASPIPATGMNPVTPVKLPAPATSPDVANPFASIAGDIASANTTVNTPTDPSAATSPANNFGDILKSYIGAAPKPESNAKIYQQEARNAQLDSKRQAVSDYSSQLNAIVAKSQADRLSLEGQGRGVTDVIIGGQQAQINKEAAIAALPIQAQLSAAQGDLAMAEAHVDKMFQIKSQDALAQYQYKSKVVDAVYQFANAQEQRRLDAVKQQEDRKYNEQQDFLKTQRSLLSSALQQGAPAGVIAKINGATSMLDVIGAAGQYNGDVLAQQIKRAQLAQLIQKSTDTSAPEVKNINGTDMQWNSKTAKWEPIQGGGPTANQGAIDSATDTIKTINNLVNHPGMTATVGAYGIGRWTPFKIDKTEQQDFIAGVNQLISGETLNALTALKAKGGSLGALSEKELEILRSTASKISNWEIKDGDKVVGYEVSEDVFKKELGRMQELAKRAQVNALGYDPEYVPNMDGGIIDLYIGTNSSTAPFSPDSFYSK